MTEDYFFEAIDVLKHLQQQSKSNMKGLEIRQVDVDKSKRLTFFEKFFTSFCCIFFYFVQCSYLKTF